MTHGPTHDKKTAFARVFGALIGRRSLLRSVVASAPIALLPGAMGSSSVKAAPRPGLSFVPIAGSSDDAVIVPEGYQDYVILRSGDSLTPDLADLTSGEIAAGALLQPGAADQLTRRFGDGCDAVHFFPLSRGKKRRNPRGDDSGILCVNHEFVAAALLFPGFTKTTPLDFAAQNPEYASASQALHGVSCFEIFREDGTWRLVQESPLNRRITGASEISISGPAAGHSLLKTEADPEGLVVRGTLNNCAGGKTPWGTYLTSEENTDQYFGGYNAFRSDSQNLKLLEFHRRLSPGGFTGGGPSLHGWEAVDPRFDVARHPTEPFRFGWIVEIDPYDPKARPKKRTALGRFKHECAETTVAASGQVVVYSGDDSQYEYVYKFVSTGKVDPDNHDANRDLLDDGHLYVARFDANGTGKWLLLDYENSLALQDKTIDIFNDLGARVGETNVPLFESQAEVLINTRAAADVLGATPMDRPEDIAVHPSDKSVFISFTNNTVRSFEPSTAERNGRTVEQGPDAPNPRGPNRWGHILKIDEDSGDQTAQSFTWDVFLLCGDPKADLGAFLTSGEDLNDVPLRQNASYFGGVSDPSALSPMGSPDNLNFDGEGNLWIVTDGQQPLGNNDGTYVAPTGGPDRGRLRQFMSAPIGAEVCGCEFTRDYRTLFLSIQHPGWRGSIDDGAASDWPDRGGALPRSSLIGIRTENGRDRIGS